MKRRVIRINDGITRMPEWRMAEPVCFELCEDEHIAIIGPNGGGKSMLVDIITGRHPLLAGSPEYDFSPSMKQMASENIKYITFKDSYGDYDGTYYLQQRWNQHDIDESTPTAGDLLEEAFCLSGEKTEERRELQRHLYELFHVGHLLDKYIISLSSGELRKFQIVRTLFSDPRVLIMDSPFIGLEADTRELLKNLLHDLSKEKHLQIITVLSRPEDIPPFITHVVEVKNMTVGPKREICEYTHKREELPSKILGQSEERAILDLPYKDNEYEADEVIRMTDVSIRYGNRTILDNISWVVRNGERWSLSGQNGAGKSTLLSLVCADNPQSYACDISLFGNKRGSGESIWDIKKHIGYVSPEMHRAYRHDLPAIRIVASGLKDSVGLYVRPDEKEYEICKWWMKVFGISDLADKPFLKLSSGEQRLVLLARAFVKDPELIILDEPFHGLDNKNRLLATEIIEAFCRRKNKTMVIVSHYAEELPKCVDHNLTLKRTV